MVITPQNHTKASSERKTDRETDRKSWRWTERKLSGR